MKRPISSTADGTSCRRSEANAAGSPSDCTQRQGIRSVKRRSTYAILLEDPDAAMPKPFVHWVTRNIRELMTAEGLEEAIRLSNGITQGCAPRAVPSDTSVRLA